MSWHRSQSAGILTPLSDSRVGLIPWYHSTFDLQTGPCTYVLENTSCFAWLWYIYLCWFMVYWILVLPLHVNLHLSSFLKPNFLWCVIMSAWILETIGSLPSSIYKPFYVSFSLWNKNNVLFDFIMSFYILQIQNL